MAKFSVVLEDKETDNDKKTVLIPEGTFLNKYLLHTVCTHVYLPDHIRKVRDVLVQVLMVQWSHDHILQESTF